MIKLNEIFEVAFHMSSLTRYSQTHLVKSESVLEHTGFVGLISYYIAVNLLAEGFSIDMGKVLRRAMVHDMDEIITGDIPRPTKYYTKEFRNAVQEIEDKNMKVLAQEIGMMKVYTEWKEAKEDTEGKIVALADTLAILYKAYWESRLGNTMLHGHSRGVQETVVNVCNNLLTTFQFSETLKQIKSQANLIHRSMVNS